MTGSRLHGVVAATAVALATSASAGPAILSREFLDTIGVNTHLGWTDSPYWDLPRVAASLDYLGVSHIRDTVGSASEARFAWLGQAGVRFCLFIGSHDLDEQLAALERLAPFVDYVEGPNETDNWPVEFGGLTGPAATEALMRHLRDWLDGHPDLGPMGLDLPLAQTTFGHTAPEDVAIDLAGLADVANAHSYAAWGQNPGAVLDERIAGARLLAPVEPVISSEAGYHAAVASEGWTGVSEEVRAAYTLTLLFAQFARGVDRTYLYELIATSDDPAREDPEAHFGLFDLSGQPRPAADALHRLHGILEPEGTFDPAPLGVAVDGMLPTGGWLEMQVSQDRYVLALWNDLPLWNALISAPLPVPTLAVEVALPDGATAGRLYDPVEDRWTEAAPAPGGRLVVQVPARPVLLEIRRAGSG